MRILIHYLLSSILCTASLSFSQSLMIYENHFDSVSSADDWHHTQDYRGGGIFESTDGQFKRTTDGFVFYYNDSFICGRGTYEFKARGWWVFLWRGSTDPSSGRVVLIGSAGSSAQYLDYDEAVWSGFDHQFHNGSILRQERQFVGQYLRDSLNSIKIIDNGDSAKIYVNGVLVHDLSISPEWRQDGYIEIGANSQTELTAFDDISVASIGAAPTAGIPLTVSESSGISEILRWGRKAGAGRGIWSIDPGATSVDSSEGEYELPPPPIYGARIDARFTGDPGLYGNGSPVDIRDAANNMQADTFKIKFQPGPAGYPITFRWSKESISGIYKGMVTLYNPPISLNMKLTDSVLIADESINTLYIGAESGSRIDVNYRAGWNLVSIINKVRPLAEAPFYQDLSSGLFSFDPVMGYQSNDTLVKGTGYWAKFKNPVYAITDTAEVIFEYTISVREGWNMIGSISEPILAASIGSIPGGIVTSNFITFDNGYEFSDTLQPMKAYWVKCDQAGEIILSGSATLQASSRIKIVPSSELPPAPPGSGDITAAHAPARFLLEEAYPNPFNPATKIKYQLPHDASVVLKVFNILGEEVRTIVDAFQPAGYKEAEFDGAGLPSGFYFYRLQAGDFSDLKKMLLIR